MQLLSSVNKIFVKKRLENNHIFQEHFNKTYFTNYFINIYWFENFYRKDKNYLHQKSLINLIFLSLIFSQKSFKHIFGLPVRGQRTWSNANTSRLLNTSLLEFKINYFKQNLIGAININNLKQIFFLNYYNWIWKIFWIKDWVFLYKKNKNLLLKNQFSKKKPLTLRKLLNTRPINKRVKTKESVNLKNIFDFIGLDELISLYKFK